MDLIAAVRTEISSHFDTALHGRKVLAAVSGGVDSTVLVHILQKLEPEFGYHLQAVTVNHNMRTDGSSLQDALFTRNFCESLSVPCHLVEISRDELEKTVDERNGGWEDAARTLRYRHFAALAEKLQAAAVFLAHNRNDQLETILERFLQGGDAAALRGIPRYRDPYFRPLLGVTRQDIERYARRNGLSWRTDPTNADTAYFRNRIRHTLMPLLDASFSGWDTAVLKTADKASLASQTLEQLADSCRWKQENHQVSAELSSFLSQPLAVRIRILYNGLRVLSASGRIPYGILRKFSEHQAPVSSNGISFAVSDGDIVLSEAVEQQRPVEGFCCIITGPGTYHIPAGSFTVDSPDGVTASACHGETGAVSGRFRLPAVIRSATSLDVIRTKQNTTKGVLKILSEWKVPENRKNEIPVIEDSEVRGIWGGIAGYDDWFVLQGVNGE